MPEGVLTPEIRSILGVETTPRKYTITRELISKFADVSGDPNPLWLDSDYAKKAGYDDVVAPPPFLANLFDLDQPEQARLLPCPLPNTLAGGCEAEHLVPVIAQQTITVTGSLTEAKEKMGKAGRLLVLVFERIYKNQDGEIVTKARQTFIRY